MPRRTKPPTPRDDRFVPLVEALDRSQAVIEFTPDGTVLGANENFLTALGYRLDEVVGQHHRMFVLESEANADGYQAFWASLAAGRFQTGEFQRVHKDGSDVWIQASYNPVLDEDGRVIKVVKLASDVTSQHLARREAIGRTQGVIEFEPDGTVIWANELFLSIVGYSLDDLVGQQHRALVPPDIASSAEYSSFWPSLARGDFKQGNFRRINRAGEEIWLHGSYNPVFDASGAVVRVVKHVSDITEQVHAGHEADRLADLTTAGVEQMTTAIPAATAKVRDLHEASSKIDGVLGVIQGLASQTSLLALNAAIEAARAGEAGQGFAVVANEVKVLAGETGHAATGISESIREVQREIGLVVELMESVAGSADAIAMAHGFSVFEHPTPAMS